MKKNRVHNTGLYRERKNKDGYGEQGKIRTAMENSENQNLCFCLGSLTDHLKKAEYVSKTCIQ